MSNSATGSRNYDTPEILGRRNRLMFGSFAPNGTSAIVQADTKSTGRCVASVTYVSTGLYDVTFADHYGDLVYADAGLQHATAGALDAKVVGYTKATKTLRLRVESSGSLDSPAAAAGTRVNFSAVFSGAVQA